MYTVFFLCTKKAMCGPKKCVLRNYDQILHIYFEVHYNYEHYNYEHYNRKEM